jgi:hypothetical protein
MTRRLIGQKELYKTNTKQFKNSNSNQHKHEHSTKQNKEKQAQKQKQNQIKQNKKVLICEINKIPGRADITSTCIFSGKIFKASTKSKSKCFGLYTVSQYLILLRTPIATPRSSSLSTSFKEYCTNFCVRRRSSADCVDCTRSRSLKRESPLDMPKCACCCLIA